MFLNLSNIYLKTRFFWGVLELNGIFVFSSSNEINDLRFYYDFEGYKDVFICTFRI